MVAGSVQHQLDHAWDVEAKEQFNDFQRGGGRIGHGCKANGPPNLRLNTFLDFVAFCDVCLRKPLMQIQDLITGITGTTT